MSAWEPLESARAFLVKRGAMGPDSIRMLCAAFPGTRIILVSDLDCVRPIAPETEPLDRIAGMVSEE